MAGDNYSYILYDKAGGTACLVDPVATSSINDFLNKKNLDPVFLVNTHGHGDHTGGNSNFIDRVEEVICHPSESSNIRNVTRTVDNGSTLQVGSLVVEILHTPGHTTGSICLKTDESLVTGDAVFLSGCGNPKFGGNTRELFKSFDDVLQPLDETLGLYPGHDYAERNLKFARSVDPDNPAVQQKLEEVRNTSGEPSSTLKEEKKYNPFFRYDDQELIDQLDGLPNNPTSWDVFKHLRQLRNNW